MTMYANSNFNYSKADISHNGSLSMEVFFFYCLFILFKMVSELCILYSIEWEDVRVWVSVTLQVTVSQPVLDSNPLQY
jgi:hypothetical protein